MIGDSDDDEFEVWSTSKVGNNGPGSLVQTHQAGKTLSSSASSSSSAHSETQEMCIFSFILLLTGDAVTGACDWRRFDELRRRWALEWRLRIVIATIFFSIFIVNIVFEFSLLTFSL